MRGLAVAATPDLARKMSTKMKAAPSADDFDWKHFEPRNMDPDSGIRSLQRMLNIDGEKSKP